LDKVFISGKAFLDVVLDQVDLATWQKAIAGTTRSTSGAAEVLTGGQVAGTKQTAQVLLFTPTATELSTLYPLKFYRAVPIDAREINMDNKQTKLQVTFEAMIDENRANGDRQWRFGDASVAADSTPPTVSSITPTEASTGQTGTVDWVVTFSEQMDPASLNDDNIQIYLNPATAGISTPLAKAMSLDATGMILTINPTASYASSTLYTLVLGPGIKDAAGNRFAGAAYVLTTT
jgi:hypothetical protein